MIKVWSWGVAMLVCAALMGEQSRVRAQEGAHSSATEAIALRDEIKDQLQKLNEARSEAEKALSTFRDALPAGTIIAYAGPCNVPALIPEGWVLCDGTAYDGSLPRYARLYNNIGTEWGTVAEVAASSTAGDTAAAKSPEPTSSASIQAKPFCVPDLRGRFIRGVSSGSGNDPDATERTDAGGQVKIGNRVGSYQTDQVGPHTHTITQTPHSHTIGIRDGDKGEDGPADGNDNIDGNPATSAANANITVDMLKTSETRPKNAAVNFLIKL